MCWGKGGEVGGGIQCVCVCLERGGDGRWWWAWV